MIYEQNFKFMVITSIDSASKNELNAAAEESHINEKSIDGIKSELYSYFVKLWLDKDWKKIVEILSYLHYKGPR